MIEFLFDSVPEEHKLPLQTILSAPFITEFLKQTKEKKIRLKTGYLSEEEAGFSIENDFLTLYGNTIPQLCRSLGTYLLNSETLSCTYPVNFTDVSVMLDCSRNGVISVEKHKSILQWCALLGINQIYLYLEDTYEVSDYPYFGAFRGRYTLQELKEMDDYASVLGIEVIPCIQTLAHLHTFLRWPQSKNFKDTEDILLAEDEHVYAFLENIIKTISSCFRSNKIHIGMDEAHGLGLGTYLKRNGYKPSFEILYHHLEYVVGICKKYNLKPYMWSDMFFRCVSPTGDYYDVENADFSHIKLPQELNLVYWDYYHESVDFYKQYLAMHKNLSDSVVFAGGCWIWNGISPNYSKATRTLTAGIQACKESGLKSIMLTAWGDNGCETPFETIIYPLIYASALCYTQATPAKEELDGWCKIITSVDADALLYLDCMDCVPGTKAQINDADNPSKYLLYQDILLGLFDAQIKGLHLSEYYSELAVKLDSVVKNFTIENETKLMFEFYAALAHFLAVKADMGNLLYEAYHQNNVQELTVLCRAIQTLPMLLNNVYAKRYELWELDYKIQGWEVLDIRFGGVEKRIHCAIRRITDYLHGKLSKIPELEEPRLPYTVDAEDSKHTLCFCNMWHNIVTAGNIADI